MIYLKYKKYQTGGEWWEKTGRGKFPIQVPASISKLQKKENLSFHEAFELLVREKVIIFVGHANEK